MLMTLEKAAKTMRYEQIGRSLFQRKVILLGLLQREIFFTRWLLEARTLAG